MTEENIKIISTEEYNDEESVEQKIIFDNNVIDCKYTKGKAQIPILNKRVINQEIQQIKSKAPIKYVHLGGTEILLKACFREGIDTPIELYLADDRIIHPIEKSIISAIKALDFICCIS